MGMTARHLLARSAAVVAAVAALALFLGSVRTAAADNGVGGCTGPDRGSSAVGADASEAGESLLDGWANRDLDIGTSAMLSITGSDVRDLGSGDVRNGSLTSRD
jgi:hypothetical protein